MNNPSIKNWLGVLALVIASTFLGCSDAPDTYNVSGNVTFDGKPIPRGLIRFVPDSSKENSGPAGVAVIIDGKYDTSAEGGKGHVGGPMVVHIEGHDPAKAKETDEETGEEVVVPLFQSYETTVELSKGDETKDFAVPAEAAKAKVQQESIKDLGGGV